MTANKYIVNSKGKGGMAYIGHTDCAYLLDTPTANDGVSMTMSI